MSVRDGGMHKAVMSDIKQQARDGVTLLDGIKSKDITKILTTLYSDQEVGVTGGLTQCPVPALVLLVVRPRPEVSV